MPHDPASRTPGPIERRLADLVGRRVFWAGLMAIVVALPVTLAMTNKLPDAPPRIRRLPEFSLLNEKSEPFGSADLAGRAWVASFVFTSCSTVCPTIMSGLGQVQHRTREAGDAVRLVTFTVDPAHDTPALLNSFARAHHASGRWVFVTGDLEKLHHLAADGFQLGFARPTDSDDAKRGIASELFDISHGQRLVLVDGERWIRGFYNPDQAGIDELIGDLKTVLRLEPSSASR